MTTKEETLEKMEYTIMLENQNKHMHEEINKLRHQLEEAQTNFQNELLHTKKSETALKSVRVNPKLFNEVE